jgi:hypothetical protein
VMEDVQNRVGEEGHRYKSSVYGRVKKDCFVIK